MEEMEKYQRHTERFKKSVVVVTNNEWKENLKMVLVLSFSMCEFVRRNRDRITPPPPPPPNNGD